MISKLLTPALGALLAVAIGMAHAESPTSMPEKMMDAMKDMVAHGMKPVMEMPAHMQATTDKDFKYLPSYMTVTGDRTVTEADFEDPAMCAGCHVPGSLFEGGPPTSAYQTRANMSCVLCSTSSSLFSLSSAMMRSISSRR